MAIRLPPVVHGVGDRAGFAPLLFKTARKKGSSAYVADGLNRWPAVHRLDAARLFRLALERGSAGASYHAVAEEGLPFRKIAEAIARRAEVPAVSIPPAEAPRRFSFLSLFVPIDNPTSSGLTQERLGWTPSETRPAFRPRPARVFRGMKGTSSEHCLGRLDRLADVGPPGALPFARGADRSRTTPLYWLHARSVFDLQTTRANSS